MTTIWRDLTGYVRFATGLRSFLRETIGTDAARKSVRRWVEQRDQRFLEKVRQAVFLYPKSPYQWLLRHAGSEYGDVERLVREDGLDAALGKLRDCGVYVTWEEFKGRTPCRRGSTTFQFQEHDFDNPINRGHYEVTSGGTSGVPTRMSIDLDDHAESAPDWAVWFAAFGWMGQPLIFWTSTHTGMANRYLKCAKFGMRYAKWFVTMGMTARQDRLRSALVHGLARRVGGFSRPEPAPVSRPGVVGEYLDLLLRQGHRPLLNTSPSAAATLSAWARQRGLSLAGVSFLLGSEAVTRARVEAIEASGGRALATYGTTEAGWIGAQFPGAEHADEVRVFRDAYSIIPRYVPGQEAAPLLLTGLRRASPKVLLNTEIGDSAIILGGGDCPAADELGYSFRLHQVRSFRKVTAFGITLAVTELYPILEESLPARFGGTLQDYQIIEDEDETGVSRMRLLMAPGVGEASATEVRDFFLRELGKRRRHFGFMARLLADANAVRVERRAPVLTARGKFLPVLTLRASMTDSSSTSSIAEERYR